MHKNAFSPPLLSRLFILLGYFFHMKTFQCPPLWSQEPWPWSPRIPSFGVVRGGMAWSWSRTQGRGGVFGGGFSCQWPIFKPAPWTENELTIFSLDFSHRKRRLCVFAHPRFKGGTYLVQLITIWTESYSKRMTNRTRGASLTSKNALCGQITTPWPIAPLWTLFLCGHGNWKVCCNNCAFS